MSLGYLANSYPMTSTTFVRREIEALEARGLPVTRYGVRHWEVPLVDPDDIEEQGRTHYLLTGNAKGLGAALASETARNPKGVNAARRMLLELTKGLGLVRPAAYLAEAAYLRQRTKRDGVTHLHCHFGTNATAVALLAHLMGGPSYSFTVHGPDEWTNPEGLRFDLKLEHAAFAVAISHYAKMQLMRWGGMQHRDKVHVARCGLNLEDFTPGPPPSESETFVCVGRLCAQKGQSLIPEAIAPLVADHPRLKVTLIGDGDTRGEIEAEVARLGLEENVEFLGWQANAEVRARLASARALLLPSFAEGLPIVIMEALALKRPALSTYIAGIPELLDDECGWIFPAGSVAHIQGAVRACLKATPKTLSAMGAEGRRRVEADHDIRRLAETLEGLFKPQL